MHRALRCAALRVSRGYPARRLEPRDPARLDRSGGDLRLGTLYRPARPAHRHRPFRSLGSGRGPVRTFRANARRHHFENTGEIAEMTKVAINGFGRIGRLVARAIL